MNIDDPILPTSCAQPTELPKDLVNDKENSDIQVQNTSHNIESMKDKSDNEYSIEQEKSNVLPENMDISPDSLEKGKASKCTYKYTKTPCFSIRIFHGTFPAFRMRIFKNEKFSSLFLFISPCIFN